jgi:hypothetical protein
MMKRDVRLERETRKARSSHDDREEEEKAAKTLDKFSLWAAADKWRRKSAKATRILRGLNFNGKQSACALWASGNAWHP